MQVFGKLPEAVAFVTSEGRKLRGAPSEAALLEGLEELRRHVS